jgi:hypothetical protein
MTGSKKYVYAVAQLEKQHVLNPDAHMFMQNDFYHDPALAQGRAESMGG